MNKQNDEVYEELIRGLGMNFEDHYAFVCYEARRYAKMLGKLKFLA